MLASYPLEDSKVGAHLDCKSLMTVTLVSLRMAPLSRPFAYRSSWATGATHSRVMRAYPTQMTVSIDPASCRPSGSTHVPVARFCNHTLMFISLLLSFSSAEPLL